MEVLEVICFMKYCEKLTVELLTSSCAMQQFLYDWIRVLFVLYMTHVHTVPLNDSGGEVPRNTEM